MSRPLRWYDLITINIFFLALTTLSQTNGLVFPLLVQNFVGEATKGARLGELRLWSLMVALLWQALMGMLSDRSTSHLGRRRPFILIGSLAMTVFIALAGVAAGMTGMAGFWFLFAIAVLQAVAANTAHGAQQGLIPDLVPDEQRGRFSAVKAVLEVPLPLILVSFTIARFISAGNLWLALGLAAVVLLVSMGLTMLAPERPLPKEEAPPLDWAPILRLVAMAAVFTAIILGLGAAVRLLGDPLSAVTAPALLLPIAYRLAVPAGDGGHAHDDGPTSFWGAMRTIVAPRLPQTATATVCPHCTASVSITGVASATGSSCCRLISPSCTASGPSP